MNDWFVSNVCSSAKRLSTPPTLDAPVEERLHRLGPAFWIRSCADSERSRMEPSFSLNTDPGNVDSPSKKNENEENIKTRQRLIHHVKNKRAMSNQWKTSSWLQHVLTPILPNSLLAQTTDQLGMKWYTSQLKLYPCYIPIGWFVPISAVLECASQVLSKLVTPVVDKSWWSQ